MTERDKKSSPRVSLKEVANAVRREMEQSPDWLKAMYERNERVAERLGLREAPKTATRGRS